MNKKLSLNPKLFFAGVVFYLLLLASNIESYLSAVITGITFSSTAQLIYILPFIYTIALLVITLVIMFNTKIVEKEKSFFRCVYIYYILSGILYLILFAIQSVQFKDTDISPNVQNVATGVLQLIMGAVGLILSFVNVKALAYYTDVIAYISAFGYIVTLIVGCINGLSYTIMQSLFGFVYALMIASSFTMYFSQKKIKQNTAIQTLDTSKTEETIDNK